MQNTEQNQFYNASNILEISQHANMMTDWDLSYHQISSGKFKSTLNLLTFDDIQIYRESFSTSVFQQGEAKKGCLNLGFYLPTLSPILWKGRVLEGKEIITIMGGEDIILSTPEGAVCLGLSIPFHHLNEEYKYKSNEKMNHQLILNTGVYSKLYHLIQALLSQPLLIATKQPREQLKKEIIDLLEENFLVCHENVKFSSYKSSSVVNTVIEYVNAHQEQQLSIADLCRMTNTSRRTLQNCFEQTINISPALFLKYLRLNYVRRILAQTTEKVSISTVATYFGFWHLSQFSLDYKRLFSELPSDTLRFNRKLMKNSLTV